MKKITGHLTCPVCYELYKKPKYLPCYHSYCEDWIAKLTGQSNITCPECRKTSPIPTGGVSQLPNNFFINRLLGEVPLKRKVEGEEEAKCDLCVRDLVEVLCLDCGAFLCHHCLDNHKYSREYQSHNTMPLNKLESKNEDLTIKPKVDYARCQQHELELNFYCETCDQLVCHYCIMKDHLKYEHDTVRKMAAKHRREMNEAIKPVEKMIQGMSERQKKTSDTKRNIRTHYGDVEKEMDRHYNKLCQKLQQQKEELKKELQEVCTQTEKELDLQLEQMEHTQAQLKNLNELNCAMKKGSDQETFLMKKQVFDDVKRLSDSYNQLDTQQIQPATVEFVPVEEYKTSLPQVGHLFYGDNSCNFKALDVPQWMFKGTTMKSKLVTEDQNNQLCLKGGKNKITIHAQSSRGDVTPVEVKDNKDGSYSASFVANQIGEVKLSVTMKEQQIKGSPFNVKVREKYTTIDTPSKVVNESGKMGRPWGITFSKNGTWAVADSSNRCVWIFDSQDKLIKKLDTKETNIGKSGRPLGVAFDVNNKLYMTDAHNDKVHKFDINGTHLLLFGTRGSDSGQLKRPMGVTIHSDKVYVAESGGDRISVFHCDGQFSHIIGSGHLRDPHYITVGTNDQLLVANCGNHCISIFTLEGEIRE